MFKNFFISCLILFNSVTSVILGAITFGEDFTISSENYEVSVDSDIVTNAEPSELGINLNLTDIKEVHVADDIFFEIIETEIAQNEKEGSSVGFGGSSNVSFNVHNDSQPAPASDILQVTPDNIVTISEYIAASSFVDEKQVMSLELFDILKDITYTTHNDVSYTDSEVQNYAVTSTTVASQETTIFGSDINFDSKGSGSGSINGQVNSNSDIYVTLVLDSNKSLNIRPYMQQILYGNAADTWSEFASVTLVMFDVGTLIYNNITLDDRLALDHNQDYSEFIYPVTFKGLDSNYDYRLELNNGAVILWSKLPGMDTPEPSTSFLSIVSMLVLLRRKR